MLSKNIFNENNITAHLVDGNFIWIAFNGTSGVSKIKKCSAFNPELVYLVLNITADSITNIWQDAGFLYLSMDSSSLGASIDKSALTISYYSKPVGVTEKTVDLICDTTDVYFLTPGLLSGEHSIVVQQNKITTSQTVINLIKSAEVVTNASKIDIDYSGKLWVVSEVSPVKLTKIEYVSGWDFSTYTLV